MATSSNSPRDESNTLLDAAITMALRLLERHGSHIPFAMVLDANGEQHNIVADDAEVRDYDILARTVEEQVRQMCLLGKLRAVAFARNISFRGEAEGPLLNAVEVNLDHSHDNAVTCILPYGLTASGELAPGELFAIDPRVSFFDPSQKGS